MDSGAAKSMRNEFFENWEYLIAVTFCKRKCLVRGLQTAPTWNRLYLLSRAGIAFFTILRHRKGAHHAN